MNWSELYPRIQIHLPGCPEMMITDVVRQKAIQFCRDTKIWEEQLNDIYPVEGIDRYAVTLPDETEVVSLASATQGSDENNDLIEHWPAINVFGLLYFVPAPNVADGPVSIRAILRPSDASTGMPDRVGRGYEQAIIHGTIAELQSIPNKSWSSIQTVAYHHSIYVQKVSEAKLDRLTGHSEMPLRVSPQTYI